MGLVFRLATAISIFRFPLDERRRDILDDIDHRTGAHYMTTDTCRYRDCGKPTKAGGGLCKQHWWQLRFGRNADYPREVKDELRAAMGGKSAAAVGKPSSVKPSQPSASGASMQASTRLSVGELLASAFGATRSVALAIDAAVADAYESHASRVVGGESSDSPADLIASMADARPGLALPVRGMVQGVFVGFALCVVRYGVLRAYAALHDALDQDYDVDLLRVLADVPLSDWMRVRVGIRADRVDAVA